MYTLTQQNSLGDVVDSMPFNSGWASGKKLVKQPPRPCACEAEGLAGAGASASVGVSEGGVRVDSGFNVSLPWLIAGGVALWLIFKK